MINKPFHSMLLAMTFPIAVIAQSPLTILSNSVRQYPLKESQLLTKAATLKARDMALKGYFSHTDPENRRFTYWLDSVGYNYAYGGENLTKGYASDKARFEGLMASPTHRENILFPGYTETGVGRATGPDGTVYVVQLFGSR